MVFRKTIDTLQQLLAELRKLSHEVQDVLFQLEQRRAGANPSDGLGSGAMSPVSPSGGFRRSASMGQGTRRLSQTRSAAYGRRLYDYDSLSAGDRTPDLPTSRSPAYTPGSVTPPSPGQAQSVSPRSSLTAAAFKLAASSNPAWRYAPSESPLPMGSGVGAGAAPHSPPGALVRGSLEALPTIKERLRERSSCSEGSGSGASSGGESSDSELASAAAASRQARKHRETDEAFDLSPERLSDLRGASEPGHSMGSPLSAADFEDADFDLAKALRCASDNTNNADGAGAMSSPRSLYAGGSRRRFVLSDTGDSMAARRGAGSSASAAAAADSKAVLMSIHKALAGSGAGGVSELTEQLGALELLADDHALATKVRKCYVLCNSNKQLLHQLQAAVVSLSCIQTHAIYYTIVQGGWTEQCIVY